MSKVNGLFMDDCEARFDALVAAGAHPEDAYAEVLPKAEEPQAQAPINNQTPEEQ